MPHAVDTGGGGRPAAAAAFFDLDKTRISRSGTLAFVPSFYRHDLIIRAQAARGAFAQLAFMASGTDHDRMERITEQLSGLGRAGRSSRLPSSTALSTRWRVLASRDRLARHVNTRFNKDHELITARSSQAGGSVVEMSNGPLVLTRQPGTHARPAAGGGRGRGTHKDRAPQATEVGCLARQ
jgi:hypothetical protein